MIANRGSAQTIHFGENICSSSQANTKVGWKSWSTMEKTSSNFPHGCTHFYHVWSMAMSGTDWLEVPTIYKAYFLGLNFREFPHKIWPTIWYSTSILWSFFIPIDWGCYIYIYVWQNYNTSPTWNWVPLGDAMGWQTWSQLVSTQPTTLLREKCHFDRIIIYNCIYMILYSKMPTQHSGIFYKFV